MKPIIHKLLLLAAMAICSMDCFAIYPEPFYRYVDGVYLIPPTYADEITIRGGNYNYTVGFYIDGTTVFSGQLSYPFGFSISSKYRDGKLHSVRDSHGQSFTFCVIEPFGDFSLNSLNYAITSPSQLEVSCVGGEVSGDLTIPSTVNYNNKTYTVVSIGEFAFSGRTLTSVTLSPEIKTIEKYAFAQCSSLEKVTLGSDITTIEDYAFSGTTSLADVEFNEGLNSLGATAFRGAGALKSVKLPASLKTIGSDCFKSCGLTELRVPDGVESIGSGAFANNTSLPAAFIGTNVKSMSGAFTGCSKLMEVFFLGQAAPVGADSFSGCHQSLECYVPSKDAYGFGIPYVSFDDTEFVYDGQAHAVKWNNNLKAYRCTVDDAVTEKNAGQHTCMLKAHYTDGVDFDVEIPYSYEVKRAPLSLTVTNCSREYGTENPAFTCDVSGFVEGEDMAALGTTPTYTCDATVRSEVGNYRIFAELVTDNYEITYKYGTLSVVKAPLEVSLGEYTRTYGDENPQFKISYTGLRNGETAPGWTTRPTISTIASAASPSGTYAVTARDGEAPNYVVAKYNAGTLTVAKRALTARAADAERLYGEENPSFDISFDGFVNGDTADSLTKLPEATCTADTESDAGEYPINVSGGEALNYDFVYENGTLTVKPLTVGFARVYDTVTYFDMAVSTTDMYFNYRPEITGPYNPDDFYLELWFLDKDNRYGNYAATITGGEYAGNYVNTNSDSPMYAGKYIFNLVSKGTNPNVTANPSRAYLTVEQASNDLSWDSEEPIVVKVGETIDLGIEYRADLYCTFGTSFNPEFIELSSDGANTSTPHWYATGLKEGTTTLQFSIESLKNDLGFYNFSDSPVLTKYITVSGTTGVADVTDSSRIRIETGDGRIILHGKKPEAECAVFNMQGNLIELTKESVIDNLQNGFYIIRVDHQTFKIKL